MTKDMTTPRRRYKSFGAGGCGSAWTRTPIAERLERNPVSLAILTKIHRRETDRVRTARNARIVGAKNQFQVSLIAEENSLFGVIDFPAPKLREIGSKYLNLGRDDRRKPK